VAAAPAAGERYVGPFDREPWPERLQAHVVSPAGAAPRMHGYDVAGDLARHYTMSEVAWLALRGELPTESQRAAFDTALILLAPTSVAQAPAHAAILSRIAGARPCATLGVAAVGLGELARSEREALAPWLAGLEPPPGERAAGPADEASEPSEAREADEPSEAREADEADEPGEAGEAREALAWLDGQLRAWFGDGGGLPARPRARVACAHALLQRLGFATPLQLELLSLWARLPAVIAEAGLVHLGDVRGYPARAPDYRYVDDEGASR
jgi:hypothetical protein